MSVQWSSARSSPGRGWILRIACVEEVSRSRNEAAREKGNAMAQYLISFPTDGTVTDGPNPDFISGITIVDVPSREEALKWAAKVAAACRCTQEVRAIGFDPELDAMLREAASRRRRHDDG